MSRVEGNDFLKRAILRWLTGLQHVGIRDSRWQSEAGIKPGVVAHACNPSTLEDQGQPLLHTEFNQGQPELHKTLSQRSTSASQGVLKHL